MPVQFGQIIAPVTTTKANPAVNGNKRISTTLSRIQGISHPSLAGPVYVLQGESTSNTRFDALLGQRASVSITPEFAHGTSVAIPNQLRIHIHPAGMPSVSYTHELGTPAHLTSMSHRELVRDVLALYKQQLSADAENQQTPWSQQITEAFEDFDNSCANDAFRNEEAKRIIDVTA